MTMPSAARYGRRPPGCSPCNRCGRPILFVRNLITGRAIPVEPIPDVDGTISAGYTPRRDLVGWPISAEHPHQLPNARYMVHAAICPVRPGPAKRARRPQTPLPFTTPTQARETTNDGQDSHPTALYQGLRPPRDRQGQDLQRVRTQVRVRPAETA